jgi:hypothetical protein
MRLVRLNLTRYGKFTDFVLDFGRREAGKPDFHIVYGPNEAGKSTTLSAWLDLLFGIEKSSKYSFLHPYDTMQVGGVLECAGGTREFVRVKKPANSLLDGGGRIVAESALAAELGGLTRQDYRLKFSLDADTLETGGDNILASKGDLGELLFAASAGVADLSRKLASLREDSDGFFKKGGRKHELADLKARIRELDAKKQSIDMLASDHARIIAEQKEAEKLYAQALADREAAKAAQDRIQRLDSALPRLATVNGLIERLEALADVPDAPPGWKEKLARLQLQETELVAHLNRDAKEIERLTDEIAAIAVDEDALRCAHLLSDMDSKRARFMTAEDISKLQPRVAALTSQISSIMRLLERADEPNPEALLLGASVTVALRGLIESWAGIETALKNAEAELGAAQDSLKEQSDRLAAAQAKAGVVEPAALAMLDPIVAELRNAALESRCGLARKALAESREHLAERLTPLSPWRGEADELVALRLPERALIERWQRARRPGEGGRDPSWRHRAPDHRNDRLAGAARRLRGHGGRRFGWRGGANPRRTRGRMDRTSPCAEPRHCRCFRGQAARRRPRPGRPPRPCAGGGRDGRDAARADDPRKGTGARQRALRASDRTTRPPARRNLGEHRQDCARLRRHDAVRIRLLADAARQGARIARRPAAMPARLARRRGGPRGGCGTPRQGPEPGGRRA